ncbi:MAG: 4Fe-4S dicluster domain-containing protein [Methanobrevibacter sp.]|nr:4Fe-4S dicluster domain-containing protein [Methanobrevibacter sp.]
MTIQKITDKPLNLAELIIEDIKSSKDEGVLKCVQCGMCTSTCPSAKHSNYNPRDIMERVLQGDESIIDDDSIWNCFYCYTCHSTCPVGNSVCEVNQIIKQIAIDKGLADDKIQDYLGFADSYYNSAIGAIPSKFYPEIKEDVDGWWEFRQNLNNIREELNLDSLTPSKEVIDEVSLILKNCGFKERIDKVRK